MSYEMALKAAGATVHCFQEFGSYQGSWYARVTYQGKTGWVEGSYGSCSGCDAFQAEFDSGYHYHGKSGVWGPDDWTPETCEQCAYLQQRLAEFGKGYLDPIMTMEEVEAKLNSDMAWDYEAAEALAYIKAHSEA